MILENKLTETDSKNRDDAMCFRKQIFVDGEWENFSCQNLLHSEVSIFGTCGPNA